MDRQVRVVSSSIAIVATVLIHAAILCIFNGDLRDGTSPTSVPEHPSEWIVVNVPNLSQSHSKAADSIRSQEVASIPGNRVASETTIANPDATDWYVAKDQVLEGVLAQQTILSKQRKFDSSDRLTSIPQPVLIEHNDFPWDPLEGKRAGITKQGVIYIKLSKKCQIAIVFAAFLGCSFGDDIKPEGDLFKDIAIKLDKAHASEFP